MKTKNFDINVALKKEDNGKYSVELTDLKSKHGVTLSRLLRYKTSEEEKLSLLYLIFLAELENEDETDSKKVDPKKLP